MFRLKEYIRYLRNAVDEHGIHSPFVFDFYNHIINSDFEEQDFREIEVLRRKLLRNQSLIEVRDFGAGSTKLKSNKRKVSEIAKYSAKPPKFARILYRISKKFRPAVMLELGTSLGISGAHLAMGNPDGRLITIEGCPNIGAMAQSNFNELAIKNIEVKSGNFDDVLPGILSDLSKIDLIFIDGNHTYEATKRYFEMVLPHLHEESIVIFDDIHWSEGMKKAWDEIIAHPSIRVSMDLFFIGIVFFNKDLSKQDFILK